MKISFRRIIFSPPFLVFCFTLFFHSINLFGNPVFLGDEGIYTFQAWWAVNFGKLAPYTYWYDHAPFGWILIGLWQKLTGGPFAFGFSLYSTRLFMVLLTGLTNIGIYLIAKHLTKSRILALLASFIFSFTPLSLIYHRQVLLDNIETFWFIWSLYFLLKANKRSLFFLASGCLFGLAFLSKEIIIFVLPTILLLLFSEAKDENKTHARFLWLSSAFFLISLFPLLAMIKGELLPSSWFGSKNHVSLLETVIFQLTRGSALKLWEQGSYFRLNLSDWYRLDPILIFGGLWATLINLLYFKKDRRFFFFGLLSLNYLLFLARGGFILGFYVIPLLAIFSVNISLAIKAINQEFNFLYKYEFPAKLALVIIIYLLLSQNLIIFKTNVTKNQLEIIDSIKRDLPREAALVVDDFAFLDLRLSRQKGDPAFPNTEWYSKVESDPDIRMGKFKDNWRNIDYLMVDDYIKTEIKNNNLPFLRRVLENSTLIKTYSNGEEKRGGILVSLYKVNKDNAAAKKGFENIVSEVSLEEKVGSLFMVGFEGTTLDQQTKDFFIKNNFKNFLIQGKNIQSEAQLKNLINDLKNLKYQARLEEAEPGSEALVAIDQEGGAANRINLTGWDQTGQPDIKNVDQAYAIAKARGEKLKNIGINMNLSPVLEVARIPNAYIAPRTFSGNENQIGELAQAMCQGYKDAGIISVPKHFPGGLGRVVADPHYTLPILLLDEAEFRADLKPFKMLTEADCTKAIMTTHILYSNQDSRWPASFSAFFINNILRNELDFKGIVIADDLMMGSVSENYPVAEAAKQAILGGADMVIISGDYNEEQRAYLEVLAEAKVNPSFEKKVEEAEERISFPHPYSKVGETGI